MLLLLWGLVCSSVVDFHYDLICKTLELEDGVFPS